MNELLCADSERIAQGGLVALKMVGAVVAAAVILWLVMILARYLGNRIERRKYDEYVKSYTQDHPDQEGMIDFNQFVAMRAAGEKVVYSRTVTDTPPQRPATEPNETPCETVATIKDTAVNVAEQIASGNAESGMQHGPEAPDNQTTHSPDADVDNV